MKFQDQQAFSEATERDYEHDDTLVDQKNSLKAAKSISPQQKEKGETKGKSKSGKEDQRVACKRAARKMIVPKKSNSPICIMENNTQSSPSYIMKKKLHLKFEEANKDSLHVEEEIPNFLPTYSNLKNYEVV